MLSTVDASFLSIFTHCYELCSIRAISGNVIQGQLNDIMVRQLILQGKNYKCCFDAHRYGYFYVFCLGNSVWVQGVQIHIMRDTNEM